MVGECLTLLLHKAVQEGERDEAEENDEENSTADHSLRLWAAAQQQAAGRGGGGERKGAWSLTKVRVPVTQSGFLPRILFCLLGSSEFVHREEFTTARRSDTQRSHSVPPRIDNSITHTPP